MTFWFGLEVAFWLSILGSVFSYFLYPILLLLAPRRPLKRTPLKKLPCISVIIAARNEKNRIEGKLLGTLALDYPRELLEIVVASDASEDGTDEIARSFASRGIRLSRTESRGGKEAAQARAIDDCTGDIIVFTDSATRLEPDALWRIAHDFSDPTMGAVSSEDRVETAMTREGSGESIYVRYEMWLRRLESDRAGLVGLSGSLFAVRRAVAQHWPTHVPSDITAALRAVSLGFRAIVDPALVGYYTDLHDPEKEYNRKVRTVVRGMAGVAHMSSLLNPCRYGLYSFQIWSHKIMRWATPLFLILTWALSGVLAVRGTFFFQFLFTLQTLGYLAGTLTWLTPALRVFRPLRLLFYLLQVHVALLDASVRYVRGERIVIWSPSVR